MSDGESLRRWTVCGRCHAVRGGPIGTVEGVTVWQRCDCARSEGLPPQPRIGDFNIELELCRACGLVPRRSGSKWSVWFCGPCATQAKRLNERVGRCVAPIGRHSLMNGVSARNDLSEEIEFLAVQLRMLFDAIDAIERWARIVVRENLVAAGQPHDVDVELSFYLASVHSHATSEQRFAEMVAHLLTPA